MRSIEDKSFNTECSVDEVFDSLGYCTIDHYIALSSLIIAALIFRIVYDIII